ncbi:zinc finger RANBP2-type containing 2 L homeolog [Xenopus laevis]|uniref:Zinc finger Ran-binding domain-containing protein 2 n=1 Tax=Xenopus laevis TaxID=8355 RepID=Q5XGW8_XENLA|nr:zinc finger RANBP2-type containing 2 L homeolog [Xenopus laevis]AAH84309.1 LOC495123 protein [Xenopus laevis]
MSTKNFRVSDGDWICPDKKCGNVNFARRTSCNRCGREKTTEAKMMKAGGTEIGKTLAEKSRGLFSANDWQCKTCGNVNWARRSECNMCNTPKYAKLEERTGYGGGFNERENVEYIEREESDGEYDEFGRKKKKYRGKPPGPTKPVIKGDKKESEGEAEEEEDEDLSKYKLDDDEEEEEKKKEEDDDEEEEEDDDDGDLSKYNLASEDEDDTKTKKSTRSSRSKSRSHSRSSHSSSHTSSRSRSRSSSRSHRGSSSPRKRSYASSRSSSSPERGKKRSRSRSSSGDRKKKEIKITVNRKTPWVIIWIISLWLAFIKFQKEIKLFLGTIAIPVHCMRQTLKSYTSR